MRGSCCQTLCAVTSIKPRVERSATRGARVERSATRGPGAAQRNPGCPIRADCPLTADCFSVAADGEGAALEGEPVHLLAGAVDLDQAAAVEVGDQDVAVVQPGGEHRRVL